MALTRGTRLGQYEILSAIGAGGMGEVYRAKDSKLGREVAIKVLPEAVAQDAERLARFEREARTLATLNHPNIVTIFAVEESGGTRFLTMELIEGETLDTVIASGGLPLSRFFDITVPLAEALSAAHERGIVHRDLKPGNVMVTREGRVKVLDFGLAKLEGPHSDPNLTNTPTETRADLTGQGQVFGTVAYMSPEQARGGKVDARSDVFSLGVVIYQLLTGERPFQGGSAVDMISSILRDKPPSVTDLRADLPPHLGKILRRCLEKDPRDRYQTSRDVYNELKELRAETSTASTAASASSPRSEAGAGARPPSGSIRADEGFWVAVMPFKHGGDNADLRALAEGLSEEIVAGLSRFSYLRVITSGSTQRYADEAPDLRVVGKDLGARYVMNGNLRQVGARLRVAVQLVDTTTGAHLWADNYERTFSPEAVFELQDELVPRIVSTVADSHGVLLHSMSEALRSKSADQLSPYEAVLRSFGYFDRVNAEELAAARSALELAVRKAPGYADAWAMLALLCAQEYGQGYSLLADSLADGSIAARRAVEAGPSNHLAHSSLAQVLFLQKEFQAFRNAAARAAALNPMDGATVALMGILLAYAGDWEHGCAMAEGAMRLNPHFPGWYRLATIVNAYRTRDYRAAIDAALRIQMPGYFWTPVFCAAAFGQLDERESARKALGELLAIRPGFGSAVREDFGKWHEPELVEHFIDGLRKAGLDVPALAPAGLEATSAREPGAVAIAVLPFSDMSPAKDQEYFCEGMAEEIMNALVRIDGIRVASRTSAFRARQDARDLAAIARALSVGHVLEGSVRTSGTRLRVTAQLTDIASGYQLWSERFDREAADVFAIQDEIAAGVVDAVKARLAPGVRTVQARARTHNLEAYRSYLKGRHLRGKEHHAEALQAFEEAVRLDPSHAPSWTGLAEITVLSAHMGAIPPRAACAAARKALATARELQGESAEGLHVEAFAAFIERRWDAMETTWRRALELQPDHVLALGSFGISLCARQKLDEALPLFERAREADPLASFPYTLAGWGLLMSGRPQDALRQLEDALTFEKEDATAVAASCIANVALGRFEEGIAAGEHGVALTHRAPFFLGVLAWALATAGRSGEARTILEELRARPAASPTVVSEAWLLGALGEIDDAFEVLARAEDEYQGLLCYTGLPGFDPLRSDPRFAALEQRLELPSALRGGQP